MKNSLFDSLFLVNLSVFCGISLFFLKVPRMAIYIVKMGGFGMAPRRCGIHSKSQSLMQKTYFSGASETLLACTDSCLRTHAPRLRTQA